MLGTPIFSFSCEEELAGGGLDVGGSVGLHFVVLRIVILEDVPAGEVEGRGGEVVGPDESVGMDEEREEEEEKEGGEHYEDYWFLVYLVVVDGEDGGGVFE